MLELVRRARRRLLNSELIAQGANAFSAALAAFILLLILGTQILEWYWLAPIPAAAAAVGIYLALRRLPSAYRTAQLVDHRAELADTLSTAFYFSDNHTSDERPPASANVLRWQQQQAEEAAVRVDLARTLPYSMPRSAYMVVALALVATSLFALRYGLSRRLDLRPPLARMIQDEFTPADKKEAAENRHRTPQGKDDADTTDSANQDQDQKGADQQNADDPADQGDSQSAEKNGDSKDQSAKPKDGDQSQDGQGQQQADEADQKQDSGEQSSNSQGESKGEQKQQSDGKQSSSNSSESGSLLSKMKDFAENLLSKMKPQPQNSPNTPQQNMNQSQKQGQGQQQKGQQQNSKDGQQGSSDQADAQQGQSGDQKDGQESQGKGSGDKSQANKQPGSGIGSEDGDKAIKRAEQLAAMGKITELIGKRSATVTGESTVEVQNTSQTLHTAYVQRSGAQHEQSGAQIDRDEIPVALQPYVEQYFDQVRKQPGAVTPVAPAAPKKR